MADSLTAAPALLKLNSATASSPVAILVDTPELLSKCIDDLESATKIAVDLEGVDLCSTGRLCLLQLYGAGSSAVWVVDVTVLGKQAFEVPEGGKGPSLKEILEDTGVRKVRLGG